MNNSSTSDTDIMAQIKKALDEIGPLPPIMKASSLHVPPRLWAEVRTAAESVVRYPTAELGLLYGGIRIVADPRVPEWLILARDSRGKFIGLKASAGDWLWSEEVAASVAARLRLVTPTGDSKKASR